MAIYGYARVSTGQQTVENQRLEIQQAGYQLDFWFADEGVSGTVPAMDRPEFSKMIALMDSAASQTGHTLIVTKLDRLGRDSVDIQQTLRNLAKKGVSVVVLQLGKTDLTSPAGKLILSVLAAVAEMERDLIVERTQAGLARARAEGKTLGRPPKTSAPQREEIRAKLVAGVSVSALSKDYGVSRASIIAIRDAAG